ncbi:hypothetical protein GGTG_03029 [Gaeumannomyces tritici R3-111a-1]|uniref:DNA repair protein RAD5 n=1 Tax=Gaeumannomyces tritici (strain R3-111a-1) TaxID=644352 RepID=J3NP23_GAET3|nr:hypothetical protein GGTG_03029 [Gaeumannomyces tritici R3-111a-1]EJT77926.1 hypothetical protein GGTG_03029 [Gaeumannomyces tritici R3-111a-1]
MELTPTVMVAGPPTADPASEGLDALTPVGDPVESEEDESMFVLDYIDLAGENEEDEPMSVDDQNDGNADENEHNDKTVVVNDAKATSQQPQDSGSEAEDPYELIFILEEEVPEGARKRMQENAKTRKQGDGQRVKREREDDEEDEDGSDDIQIIEKSELSAEALRRIKEPRLPSLKKEGQTNQTWHQQHDRTPAAIVIDDDELQWVKTLPRTSIPSTIIEIKEEDGGRQESMIKAEEGTSSSGGKGKAKADGTFTPVDGVEQALAANWGGSSAKTVMMRYLRQTSKLLELDAREKESGAVEVETFETRANLRKKVAETEIEVNRLLANRQENPDDEGEDDGSDTENPDDPDYVDQPAGSAPAPRRPRGRANEGRPATRKPQFVARSAKEWWARRYARSEEKGRKETDVVPDLFHAGSRESANGGKKGKRAAEPTDARDRQMLDMLRDQDPVAARAALGDIPMPGAITTTKKNELFDAMREEAANNAKPKTVEEEMKILRRASASFGRERCKAAAGLWELRWMKSRLYHHQLVGVHWMLGREFSPSGPHGGILADQMGLGKTVEMLAVITHNPGKPTLIVVPAAAVSQWQEEIRKHVEAMPVFDERNNRTNSKPLRVFQYKARGPNNDINQWSDADIVLVSYQEVARAYPSEEALRRISGMGLEGDEWRREMDKQLGQLYKVQFHRIVLDEAHAIKNINSRTSKACIHLPGKYRWALSGTPIHNSIEELLPYFKFLGADWALRDMEKFSKKYGRKPWQDNLNARLVAIVPTLMIRRRVDDKFVGQDLLRIPKTNQPVIIKVDLSVEERIIYKRVEHRFRDNISNSMKTDAEDGQGHGQKKMRTYFAYLTRLRQLVGHPFQIETTMRVDFTLEDIRHVRMELAQLGGQTPLYMQIRRWMDTEEDRKRREQEEEVGFGSGGFGGLFNMDRQLSRIESEKQLADVICRICYELHDEETRITECGHAFCFECIQNLVEDAGRRGRQAKCPACSAIITSHVVLGKEMSGAGLGGEINEPAGRDGGRRGDGKPPAKKARKENGLPGKGSDFYGVELRNTTTKSATFLRIAEMNENAVLPASAKTTAVKRKIIEWLKHYPNDKIIVFTHWVNLAQVIGHMLNSERIGFLYYFGAQSIFARRNAVAEFSKDDTPVRVLLASTKCGGQALNLTAANRVILVDLWWNSAVEQQAFGRVHRIGQTKETHFVKVVARNTIDERLLDMQNEKDVIIGRTMRDGQSLTETEILRLFGAEDDNVEGQEEGGEGDDEAGGSSSNKVKGKAKAKAGAKARARGRLRDVCDDDIDRGEILADSDTEPDTEARQRKPGKAAPRFQPYGERDSGEGSSGAAVMHGGGSDAGDEVVADAVWDEHADIDDETMQNLLLQAQLAGDASSVTDHGENEPLEEDDDEEDEDDDDDMDVAHGEEARGAAAGSTPHPADDTAAPAPAWVDADVAMQDQELRQPVAMGEEEGENAAEDVDMEQDSGHQVDGHYDEQQYGEDEN